ncbi:AGZA family xanthine/uracil permease-like MFS transporter [Actinocorallia herbida]|uniref:AGZA family xanthine/uracil permease-like MFS transporter n=1 Tax=Actinocorallia herbida TaxID=58109 RepID=A0A3N1D450_9ACTN|nr:regulator [Actinocorallia herbida]ROO88295.1 AGZA family xanthine/uracil permease-like MFS transporter [Actinocorallia herbida]
MSTDTKPAEPAETPAPFKLPFWVGGDTNAFFGLGFNVMVNVLVLTGLCLGVVNIPGSDVYGVILPALGIQMLIGNVYYTYLARRLAAKEGRTDVCAMPYGPSVPHMFIVTFVIMLPIYLATKDPLAAWAAGLAWSFIIGLIVILGAFVGPYIRKYTPQAAMLGTLAGISIAFISMRPTGQMFEAAWIALPVLIILLIGFFTDLKLPFGLPVGLVALLVGSAIGWIGGYMEPADVTAAAKDIAIGLPTLQIDLLIDGLKEVSPLLATAIPLGIYNFTEGMTNVESAAVAGDEYNLRAVLFADGLGAVVGAGLGSPFPPAVYIGHPGWKAAGGRTAYSLATGVVIALFCFLGFFAVLGALLPTPAIVPILLYIGLLIGAQAFQEVPKAHAIAVVMAIIPNVASWAVGQMDNVLSAAGTSAAELGEDALAGAGVVYHGLKLLGGGAILAGLVLGAIVAFIIDRRFVWAAGYAAAGAVLSFIGLVHAEKVEWNAEGQVALGYLLAGAVLLLFAFLDGRRKAETAPQPALAEPEPAADAEVTAAK